MIKFLLNLIFNGSNYKLGESTEPRRPEFSQIPAETENIQFTVIGNTDMRIGKVLSGGNSVYMEVIEKVIPMKIYITVDDILTSSGRYPERAKHIECTDEVKTNAAKLCDLVNSLLTEIKWTKDISISSGFRPSEVNAKVKGAAKKSAHQIGKACDVYQSKDNNELGKLIRKIQDNKGKQGTLGKHGLMMESLESTIGQNSSWVHLDLIIRSERPSMEFKP